MAKKKKGSDPTQPEKQTKTLKDPQEPIVALMEHYIQGETDVNQRRNRKKGWRDILDAFMNKVPANWPYTAKITDPVIRSTILEKTARLLNSKLQGRLVPREDGDMVKARINNLILDYQWDAANSGGSMIQKVAIADQVARLYGSAFVLVYWDPDTQCNEIKVLNPHDVFVDPTATHVSNANYVQIREYTTREKLADRGYSLTDIDFTIQNIRDGSNESIVRLNRGLQDQTGHDRSNPVLELVTEWTADDQSVFLPGYKRVLDYKKKHTKKRIPIAMLRYYPVGDDVYGESEVESVLSLQKAINAIMCGYIDEMNLSMRPPLMLVSGQYRAETIEYGPGAQWVVNSLNSAREVQMGGGAVQAFNNTYPALKAAFNTAMGDQSLGVSNVGSYQTAKTATEVSSLQQQQNSRDQYNQLYLAEFLKDVMLMWIDNNREYLFADSTLHYKIIKIVGKQDIQELEQLGLSDMHIPDHAMSTIADTIQHQTVPKDLLDKVTNDVSVPTNPVVTNPNDQPAEHNVMPKLHQISDSEANLYITKDDMEDTLYEYIPDVKSMAAGAGVMMQQARQNAYQLASSPEVSQALMFAGKRIRFDKLFVQMVEDSGLRDGENLIEDLPEGFVMPPQRRVTERVDFKDLSGDAQQQFLQTLGIQVSSQNAASPLAAGAGASPSGQPPGGTPAIPGLPGPQGMAAQPGLPGLPDQAQGLQPQPHV